MASEAIGCCLVLDSSALLCPEIDMHDLLARKLPSSHHVAVIPRDVVDELYGLLRCENGAVAILAAAFLALFDQSPQFHHRAPAPPSAVMGGRPPVCRRPGAVLRQKSKETFYPLEKFARNRDTKIVACAHYFTVCPAASARGSRTRDAEGLPSSQPFADRCFGCTKNFFVTNDLMQQLKASAYNIPTIDARTLAKHFGRLSAYEPQHASRG
ncbi:hypothetical protein LSCM1_01515 [Leishmania martiniquensis]|uniref:PIN domain-containing protein n=1 Tax=Leishmania martiniquensis TaxID=1580590 RepID=A0A836KG31_9TRYP|nr:hypothetical protein LSCM1_01515 [Leishmania martiniquensis]